MTLADLVPEQYRAPGLTPAQLDEVQERAGAYFPPDLCELLSATLPTGPQFPDWRTQPRETLEAFRDRLIRGIEFDATQNDTWLESWGDKPTDDDELRELIAQQVRDAPTLIPIYSHRAIPNDPLEAGNPVFSIVQTDIIVFGLDLARYLRNEFAGGWTRPEHPPRTIRFWTELLDAN